MRPGVTTWGRNTCRKEGASARHTRERIFVAVLARCVCARPFNQDSISSFITMLTIPLEKAMAPHSSTLAWKIPWTEEPGRLQSTGSLRVGHDWATSLSLSLTIPTSWDWFKDYITWHMPNVWHSALEDEMGEVLLKGPSSILRSF